MEDRHFFCELNPYLEHVKPWSARKLLSGEREIITVHVYKKILSDIEEFYKLWKSK